MKKSIMGFFGSSTALAVGAFMVLSPVAVMARVEAQNTAGAVEAGRGAAVGRFSGGGGHIGVGGVRGYVGGGARIGVPTRPGGGFGGRSLLWRLSRNWRGPLWLRLLSRIRLWSRIRCVAALRAAFVRSLRESDSESRVLLRTAALYAAAVQHRAAAAVSCATAAVSCATAAVSCAAAAAAISAAAAAAVLQPASAVGSWPRGRRRRA